MDFAARTAQETYNRWPRILQPWPGAFTALNGKKLIVHRMTVTRGSLRRGPWVCIAGAWLELLSKAIAFWPLAPKIPGSNSLKCSSSGKKRMTTDEFLRGNPLPADARLG